MLMNMATLAAYCTISLAFAEYQKTEWFYLFSIGVILLFGGLSIWDLVCLLGWKKLKHFFMLLWNGIKAMFRWMKKAYPKIRLVLPAMAVLIGFTVYNYHDTEYYRNVAELFGIPMGVGEPLSAAERQNCAGYWKIQNYPIKSRVELEYQEPYGQMKIMREYSTLYGMGIFQPASRIVCCYRKGERDKYRSYGQEYFMTARGHGFREPIKTSYYGDDDSLVLELKRVGDEDIFQITAYSSEDMPQLLNSTLLRIPQGESGSRGILFQKIEISYNEDGLPKTCRLSGQACNLYGINGEAYSYDQNNRITSLYYLDMNGEPVCSRMGVMMMAFSYDEKDNIQSIRYYSDEGGQKKTEGFYGVFCEKFQYDAYGNLTERRQLGRSENRQDDENGVCIYQYSYDGPRLTGERFLNYDREAAEHKGLLSSYAGFESKAEYGRIKLKITLDLVERKEEDQKEGMQEERLRTDLETEPKNDGEGEDWEADEEKRIELKLKEESIEGMDQNGDFVSSHAAEENFEDEKARRYSSIQYEIGPKHNILSVGYFDSDDRPTVNEDGYVEKKFFYDGNLRLTDEWYYDYTGRPCPNKDGYAAVN